MAQLKMKNAKLKRKSGGVVGAQGWSSGVGVFSKNLWPQVKLNEAFSLILTLSQRERAGVRESGVCGQGGYTLT
jgi:hypothetical protein